MHMNLKSPTLLSGTPFTSAVISDYLNNKDLFEEWKLQNAEKVALVLKIENRYPDNEAYTSLLKQYGHVEKYRSFFENVMLYSG